MTGEPRTSAATVASIHARQAVAAVRRDLESGALDLVALLTSPSMGSHRKACARTPVGRLLRSVPGVGEETARLACAKARVDRSARLGTIDDVRLARLAVEAQRWDLSSYSGSGPRRKAS